MNKNPADTGSSRFREVKHHSVAPYYVIAVSWILFALLFPMYKMGHFAVIIIISIAEFVILRKIVIKYSFNIIHINSTGCYIGCNQNIGCAFAEVLHDTVTLRLFQIPMKAGCKIPTADQRSSQQIYLFLCIAEDYGTAGRIDIKKTG